ncbi:MAG: Na+/H+ antiporter NhaC family protein [Bacilli bacterium]
MDNKVLNISKKSFISVVIILLSLIFISIGSTYLIPRGIFGTTIDSSGNSVVDYTNYISLTDAKGINILKGIFAPILVLFSKDGLTILMLSLFLLVISAVFQIMGDTNGIKVIVKKLITKFINKSKLLIAIITLIFMLFGSLLGLFEEVLTLLPIIVMLCISLGYDGFTGFLVCIVATGFGFASGITNPFTVITASEIIGVSPMVNIWFRILVFIIMYLLLLGFIFIHIRRITKNPSLSPTFETDQRKRNNIVDDAPIENEKRIFYTYLTFLLLVIVTIIIATSIEAIRSYTVVFLIVIFLFGGIVAGYIAEHNFKKVMKSFLNGIVAALPAIVLILLASSIKYILEEGQILATIAHSISNVVLGKNIYAVALLLYAIILILEFFISSSTAKAVFVMGILSCISIDLSKELLVLIYLFGDGYTNVIFPTSPVILIGLSMIGMNYFSWIKKSKWLIIINLIVVIGLICLAILIRY